MGSAAALGDLLPLQVVFQGKTTAVVPKNAAATIATAEGRLASDNERKPLVYAADYARVCCKSLAAVSGGQVLTAGLEPSHAKDGLADRLLVSPYLSRIQELHEGLLS